MEGQVGGGMGNWQDCGGWVGDYGSQQERVETYRNSASGRVIQSTHCDGRSEVGELVIWRARPHSGIDNRKASPQLYLWCISDVK